MISFIGLALHACISINNSQAQMNQTSDNVNNESKAISAPIIFTPPFISGTTQRIVPKYYTCALCDGRATMGFMPN